MKKIIITLILLAFHGCEQCPAMDRFAALSMIESGDRDAAVGHDGEISRYQIKPHEWEQAWYFVGLNKSEATNSVSAYCVAERIMEKRGMAFWQKFHRGATDFEWYVLWNRPAVFFTGRKLTAAEADRAQRFANLCSR